ncbi:MAG: hypothetical protein PHE78_08230 [Candidatus Gastranaerophilales bacterium]|nr:hypothetical protein [Candidatus Gastranaerophilales bacterium]
MVKEYLKHRCYSVYDANLARLLKKNGVEFYGAYWIICEYLWQKESSECLLGEVKQLAENFGFDYEQVIQIFKNNNLFEITNGQLHSGVIWFDRAEINRKKALRSKAGKISALKKKTISRQHLLNQHLLNQHLLNQHLLNQHLLSK